MTEQLTARDMMVPRSRLVVLRPEQYVHDAIDLLLSNRVAGACVIDEDDRIVGFLSEKDCMQCLLDAAYDGSPSSTVGGCMSRDVATISEDTDVLSVAQLFLTTHYRRLPVVREGQLVGQISRRDFLKALASATSPNRNNKFQPTFLYFSSVTDRRSVPIA